tara:strand:- start:591 stop:1058 length:468 start_codon:yes stop_codon:yes gene_type:complete
MLVTYNYTKLNGETRDIVTDGRFEQFIPKYILNQYAVNHRHELSPTHARVFDTEKDQWRTLIQGKINYSKTSFEDELNGVEEEVDGENIQVPNQSNTLQEVADTLTEVGKVPRDVLNTICEKLERIERYMYTERISSIAASTEITELIRYVKFEC